MNKWSMPYITEMGSSFTATIRKIETDIVVDSRTSKNSPSMIPVPTNDNKPFGPKYWQSFSSIDSIKPTKPLEDGTATPAADMLSLEQLASQPPILTPSWEILRVGKSIISGTQIK